MNKNILIAFLMGTILTLLVINYLPKFDIKIEVTEKSEPVKEDKTEKNELSEQTSIFDHLKSKILPEPVPEITADQFLFKIPKTLRPLSECLITREPLSIPHWRQRLVGNHSKEFRLIYTQAIESYNNKDYDQSLDIINNSFKNDLTYDDKISLYKLISRIYVKRKEYLLAAKNIKKSFCLSNTNSRIQNGNKILIYSDLLFSINDKEINYDLIAIKEIIYLLEFLDNNRLKPSNYFLSLIANSYLYLASQTIEGSLAEKQFYLKAKDLIEPITKGDKNSRFVYVGTPNQYSYNVYLDILLYEKNYEEAFIVVQKLHGYFPENIDYEKLLITLENIVNIKKNTGNDDKIITIDSEPLKKEYSNKSLRYIKNVLKYFIIDAFDPNRWPVIDGQGNFVNINGDNTSSINTIPKNIYFKYYDEVMPLDINQEKYAVKDKTYEKIILPKDFYLKRTKVVAPKYPKKGLEKGIEGWVQLLFDVDKKGNVINSKVYDFYYDSYPFAPNPGFNGEAHKVFKKWKYEPYKINDEVFETKNITHVINFVLED